MPVQPAGEDLGLGTHQVVIVMNHRRHTDGGTHRRIAGQQRRDRDIMFGQGAGQRADHITQPAGFHQREGFGCHGQDLHHASRSIIAWVIRQMPFDGAAEALASKPGIFADHQAFGNVDAAVDHHPAQPCAAADMAARQDHSFFQRGKAVGAHAGEQQAAPHRASPRRCNLPTPARKPPCRGGRRCHARIWRAERSRHRSRAARSGHKGQVPARHR